MNGQNFGNLCFRADENSRNMTFNLLKKKVWGALGGLWARGELQP